MVGLPEIRVERGLSEECGWVVHGLGLPKVHVRGLSIHFVVCCSCCSSNCVQTASVCEASLLWYWPPEPLGALRRPKINS